MGPGRLEPRCTGVANQRLLEEAQTLVGDWNGNVQLSELASDGNSRNNYQFDANMIFYQDKNNRNSLSGNGIEIDYATDGSDDQQTLKFSWYIDNNGDIYIKYASGATYVMDANASQYGFHLGPEQGKRYDTFFGYMIGIGMAKGISYILIWNVTLRMVLGFPEAVLLQVLHLVREPVVLLFRVR